MLLVTLDGVKDALELLADAWPNIRKKCEAPSWQNSIVRLAERLRLGDDDLDEAAMWIIDHSSSISSTVGLSELFAEAFQAIRHGAGVVEAVCHEEQCHLGWLEVVLEDGPICVPCPYCALGEQHRRNNPWHGSPKRESRRDIAVAQFGEVYVSAVEAQVREALQLYDADRQEGRHAA